MSQPKKQQAPRFDIHAKIGPGKNNYGRGWGPNKPLPKARYRIFWRDDVGPIFLPLNTAARVQRALHSQVGNYNNALLSTDAN